MSDKTRKTKTCPRCGGCGRVRLSAEETRALRVLRRKSRTTPELFAAMGDYRYTRSALNNVLRKLEHEGHVRRVGPTIGRGGAVKWEVCE